jgi:outer membrane protein assembly factor BamA
MRTLLIVGLLLLSWPLHAGPSELQQSGSSQSQSVTTPHNEETSAELRTQQIESARTEKEANLQPEPELKLQHDIEWVQTSFPYRLVTAQFHGFGLGFGKVGAGTGFAVGPQFSRTDFLDGKMALRVGARGSVNRSYFGNVELSVRDLAGGHAFLNFGAAHQNISEMPYYGPGPDSEKSGRSDYRLEATTLEVRPGIAPFRHVRLGAIGAYSRINVGPGHSTQYISSERKYTPETTPGIDRQTEFWRGGGFLEYDWRDRDWAPSSGGKYKAEYTRFLDRNLDRYSFLRTDFDAAQYIPIFNHTRVITLHGATSLTKTNGTQVVPFYLQPTLGGADTLRGYRSFRFYGSNSVLVNAEYRWDVTPTASFMAFADAGRVFDRWAQWNLHHAESDVGFGFAFRTETKIAFRLDTGFSHEGVQIWFRANNMF